MFLELKYKLLRKTSKKPEYGNIGATGTDVFADIKKPIILNKLDTALIPTGISLELYGDTEFIDIQLRARSSSFFKGIMLVNGVGTIDLNYRGEIMVPLVAIKDNVRILPGERIAQLVLGKAIKDFEMYGVKKLSKTQRGNKGFGSTDKILKNLIRNGKIDDRN